jgi:hypothetical protein
MPKRCSREMACPDQESNPYVELWWLRCHSLLCRKTGPLVRDFIPVMEAAGLSGTLLTAHYTTWSVMTQKINTRSKDTRDTKTRA